MSECCGKCEGALPRLSTRLKRRVEQIGELGEWLDAIAEELNLAEADGHLQYAFEGVIGAYANVIGLVAKDLTGVANDLDSELGL